MPNIMLTTHHKCTFQQCCGEKFSQICRPVTDEGDTANEWASWVSHPGFSDMLSFNHIVFPLYHAEVLWYQKFWSHLILSCTQFFFTIELDKTCVIIYTFPTCSEENKLSPSGLQKEMEKQLNDILMELVMIKSTVAFRFTSHEELIMAVWEKAKEASLFSAFQASTTT